MDLDLNLTLGVTSVWRAVMPTVVSMLSLWISRGVVFDLRNWQGKGLYGEAKGHNGDSKDLELQWG